MGVLCGLFGKSRQAFYKGEKLQEQEDFREEILLGELRKLRQTLPSAGVEKLHFLLQESGIYEQWGIKMGRDKLGDLLVRSGLGLKRRRNRKRTTNSLHSYRKYPNLLKKVAISSANQAWVSDITYVPVLMDFCYLSLITDAHSRKIVGWYLSKNLTAEGSLKALEMAIRKAKKTTRKVDPSF